MRVGEVLPPWSYATRVAAVSAPMMAGRPRAQRHSIGTAPPAPSCRGVAARGARHIDTSNRHRRTFGHGPSHLVAEFDTERLPAQLLLPVPGCRRGQAALHVDCCHRPASSRTRLARGIWCIHPRLIRARRPRQLTDDGDGGGERVDWKTGDATSSDFGVTSTIVHEAAGYRAAGKPAVPLARARRPARPSYPGRRRGALVDALPVRRRLVPTCRSPMYWFPRAESARQVHRDKAGQSPASGAASAFLLLLECTGAHDSAPNEIRSVVEVSRRPLGPPRRT
jgi:hypothetical protein